MIGAYVAGLGSSTEYFPWAGLMPPTFFAIEKERALTVIREFAVTEGLHKRDLAVEVLPNTIVRGAREDYWCAAFPDGLAVLSFMSRIRNLHRVRFDQSGTVRDENSL